MRRILVAIIVIFTLCGCEKTASGIDQALGFRERLLRAEGCSFDVTITADYGDKIYTFAMQCQLDSAGKMEFCVTAPEKISGIQGVISDAGGNLVFNGQALMFETLADGQITPVTAPWVFVRALRGGYLKASGKDGDGLHIQIDDSYEENALQLDIWTDKNILPIRAEILWKGRRIVSMDVENFTFL